MNDSWPTAIEWIALVLVVGWIWTSYIRRGR